MFWGVVVSAIMAVGGWLGLSEGLSSPTPAEVTQTAMEVSSDYRCCLRAAYIHTRAVEPLVPYVDNIHEVIKKPFVAKGPPQFAMKACNSSFSCSMCQAASVANPAC